MVFKIIMRKISRDECLLYSKIRERCRFSGQIRAAERQRDRYRQAE